MEYPKTREENLAWRVRMLRKCKDDLEFRTKMIRLFHEDIIFAFNAFYYTYDVRKRPYHNIPFMTWTEYQDDAILELQHHIKIGKDVLFEKSRDMGVSWLVILVFHHFWISPTGGTDFLLGSRIEDYVDKRGDMRTLFEKLRYAHYKLPRWLWPKGFIARKHDNYAKFINPETGAVISGESNNPNFGTGGRYLAILFDEFAKWDSTDEAAWTSAGDATPCRVGVSTPFGAQGQYYFLISGGQTDTIRLHWSLHPEKAAGISCVWPPPNEDSKGRLGELWRPQVVLTSPWYEEQKARRTAREVAQELDIDYIGSGKPIFDGKAGESLRVYLSLPDEPIGYLNLLLEELSYEKFTEAPMEREGYAVVYHGYDSTHAYTIGVDVVEGVEDGDYAIITVLDRITKHIVCSYFSAIDEVMLARAVKIISDYYSPEPESAYAPWVGIETNGPGLATFDTCVNLGMTNLFMAPRYDVTNATVSYKKGWKTDQISRNELISGIRSYLIDKLGELNNKRLVGELISFARSKTGKPQAKAGTHDDEVIAFGIAIQVDELAPLDIEELKAARKIFLEDMGLADPTNFDDREELTIEQKCFNQALAAQLNRSDNQTGLLLMGD